MTMIDAMIYKLRLLISRRYRDSQKKREIEKALREAGYSRTQSTKIASIVAEVK
jgi:hypothetical protein